MLHLEDLNDEEMENNIGEEQVVELLNQQAYDQREADMMEDDNLLDEGQGHS